MRAVLAVLARIGLLGVCAAGCAEHEEPSPPPMRCAPQGAVARAPGSIPEAVELINALPRPLTLTCYLESLERPLQLNATRGVISLQPAQGDRSPRVFLFSGRLITSVVPDGPGSALMELGEFVDATRTIKAEVAFPVTGRLTTADVYRRVRDASGSRCGLCHRDEAPVASITDGEAYASSALRPLPEDWVGLSRLAHEQAICDPTAEPARCALLDALLGHGEVAPWLFPETVPTIFY